MIQNDLLILNEKQRAQIIFIQRSNTLISLLIIQTHEGNRTAFIIEGCPEHTELANDVYNEVKSYLAELNLQDIQVLNHGFHIEQSHIVMIELALHASLGILNAFQNGELTALTQVTQSWLNEYLHRNMNHSEKSTQTHILSLKEQFLGLLSHHPRDTIVHPQSILPVVLGIILSYMYMVSN